MKKVFALIVIVVIALLLNKLPNFNQIPVKKEAAQTISKSLTVYQKINTDSQGQKDFEKLTISENNLTALTLLKKKSQVKTQGNGTNAFVVEINGRAADQNKKEFWAFYVNGKEAQVGAGSYKLQNNDKVEWKIQNF